MLDNAIYMAINFPRPHQAVITKLIARLYPLFENQKIKLQPYPETMLDSAQSSPVPDVILVNPETEQPTVIIEIANKTGFKGDCVKIKKLIDEQLYEINEGFVYNYQTQQWFKYQWGLGEITKPDSITFCESIGYDLAELLK